MKRLFVSDLDGTLLQKDAEFSAYTAKTLNEAIKKGLKFTISTARTPASALQILDILDLNLPIMLMNGVLTYDPVSKRYLTRTPMDNTVIMVLLGLIKMKGLSCFLYALKGEEFVAYYDSVDSQSLNHFRNESIMKYGKKYEEVADLSLVAGSGIIYCVLREEKSKLESLCRELSVVKGVKYEFYPDVYTEDLYMLEIYSDKASKKAGIDYLKNTGGYDVVVGFGDNLNDISLLEACDYFYAVANAHPELQNMATSVIPSNEEDGVARFIEQMLIESGK